jgi:hypothetical protein
MKAVKINGSGGVDVLEYFDAHEPTPGEYQVLVEIAAAGVNFMDVGKRRRRPHGGAFATTDAAEAPLPAGSMSAEGLRHASRPSPAEVQRESETVRVIPMFRRKCSS